jgi:hypothetical protein
LVACHHLLLFGLKFTFNLAKLVALNFQIFLQIIYFLHELLSFFLHFGVWRQTFGYWSHFSRPHRLGPFQNVAIWQKLVKMRAFGIFRGFILCGFLYEISHLLCKLCYHISKVRNLFLVFLGPAGAKILSWVLFDDTILGLLLIMRKHAFSISFNHVHVSPI